MVTKPQPQQLVLAAIITTVSLSLLTGSIISGYAQAPIDISNPGQPTTTQNQTSPSGPLLLGCTSGLAIYKSQNTQTGGLGMGCLVKPFSIKAFNGTKVLNDGNISSTGNVSADLCHTIFNGVHGLFIKDASGKFVKFLCSSLTPK